MSAFLDRKRSFGPRGKLRAANSNYWSALPLTPGAGAHAPAPIFIGSPGPGPHGPPGRERRPALPVGLHTDTAGPGHPHTGACPVIGDGGCGPADAHRQQARAAAFLVGRRRGADLTPGRRLISNQFQSGGWEATKVGEIRCREPRSLVLDPGRAHGPLFAMMPPDPARDDWDVMCPAGLAACGGTRVSAKAGEAPG